MARNVSEVIKWEKKAKDAVMKSYVLVSIYLLH